MPMTIDELCDWIVSQIRKARRDGERKGREDMARDLAESLTRSWERGNK